MLKHCEKAKTAWEKLYKALGCDPGDDARPQGHGHPVAAIGEVPEPTCVALQLEVRLVTGDGVFPHEYTHISWDLDSAVFPPPSECSRPGRDTA